ncbi:MAG: FkbM family methyltransferase [Lachnospiraceae bacterium]|nr:FkbM family methyltransferase [Lachnospiraceae bacterium]
MKKTIIYGMGEYYRKNIKKLPSNLDIIAYAESNYNDTTTATGRLFEGKRVLSLEELGQEDYDYIYICTSYTAGNRIFQYLMNYNVDIRKIRFLNRIDVLEEGDEWEYEAEDDKCLISKIGNIRIRERYLTDFDIVAEVFINNAYRINFLQENAVVIDIGMNIGAVSLYFASKEWVSKVYGFEPFPDTFQQALDNFELNDIHIKRKLYPMNVALSDKEEDIEVAVNSENTGWRSIMSKADDKRKEKISCKDASEEIRKIIDENGDKKVILKVDTEGSEFAIFNSIKRTDLLHKIDAIMIEYHRNPKEIIDLLSSYCFKSFVVGEKIGMIYAVK